MNTPKLKTYGCIGLLSVAAGLAGASCGESHHRRPSAQDGSGGTGGSGDDTETTAGGTGGNGTTGSGGSGGTGGSGGSGGTGGSGGSGGTGAVSSGGDAGAAGEAGAAGAAGADGEGILAQDACETLTRMAEGLPCATEKALDDYLDFCLGFNRGVAVYGCDDEDLAYLECLIDLGPGAVECTDVEKIEDGYGCDDGVYLTFDCIYAAQ